MSAPDLAALRAAAEAATPWTDEEGTVLVSGRLGQHRMALAMGGSPDHMAKCAARSAFIVAASPAVVLALLGRLERAEAENADLRTSIVAFCAPWAAKWAREHGLPHGQLHPTHYDILEKAGARMDGFTRAALGAPAP